MIAGALIENTRSYIVSGNVIYLWLVLIPIVFRPFFLLLLFPFLFSCLMTSAIRLMLMRLNGNVSIQVLLGL